MIPTLPPGYSVRFADGGHQPIRTMKEFDARCGIAVLGLYRGKTLIGTGELCGLLGWKNSNCHTDAMALRKKWRKKGHGIHLYLSVIRMAQKLGMDRIYSSWSLNKNSR